MFVDRETQLKQNVSVVADAAAELPAGSQVMFGFSVLQRSWTG